MKLLISCKFWETTSRRKYKGRVVALSHLFWNKSMRIVKNAMKGN